MYVKNNNTNLSVLFNLILNISVPKKKQTDKTKIIILRFSKSLPAMYDTGISNNWKFRIRDKISIN